MKSWKLLLALLLIAAPANAVTEVCVEVEVKSWEKEKEKQPDADRTHEDQKKKAKKRSLLNNSFGQVIEPGADPNAADTDKPTDKQLDPKNELKPGDPVPFLQEGEPKQSMVEGANEAKNEPKSPLFSEEALDPHEIDPARYLERMLEYEVTHERGFLSVDKGCKERVTVELYALEEGWTVFARYSGHAREEKVDHVELDEFVELAQRVIRALLRDQPISETITRENVLKADSEIEFRTIRGTGHLLFGMGTALRVGMMPTVRNAAEPAEERLRLLTPLSIHLGYRGKLKAWGLDAFVRMHVGTAKRGIRSNPLGGHVDYAGSGLAGLHFLRYQDASGIGSVYFGGGASFELSYFEAISTPNEFGEQDRRQLIGGGLNLDALLGYEFMRTSSVHFFTQIEVHAPTYLIDTERGNAKLKAYLPGGLAQIGVVF